MIAADSASMAWSCPKITSFRLRSRLRSTSRSDVETVFGGMRAMRATTSSICATSTEPAALGHGLQALARARLVDHVDGLVGQVAVVDVARRELRRGAQRVVGVA